MQHWTRRYGRLQGGRLFTFEAETKEPREVIDFTEFQEISMMDTEECSVPLNFKVNTSRGHYYFYAESKRDRAHWIQSILAMMTAINLADEADTGTGGDLTRNSSMKSVKSMHSTRTMASSVRS